MKVTKGQQIRLNPTPEQEAYFWKAAGVARFAFNWGLAELNRLMSEGQTVNITGKGDSLKSRFAAIKNSQFPWVSEVTSYAYQQAFIDLQAAKARYFRLKKEGKLVAPKGTKPRKDGRPFGWPKFKSKFTDTPSFYLANTCFKFFEGHLVMIEKRLGVVNMAEPRRFEGKLLAGRIRYEAGHWWLSIQVEMEIEQPEHNQEAVGVDLGIKYLAKLSDGQEFENPKALQQAEAQLRRLQRRLDRQRRANNPDNYEIDGTVKAGAKEWRNSKNMQETEAQIAKLHFRVKCIRQEAAHQMTTAIAQQYGIIGLEDLNVKGMMQNGRLSKALSDAALYEKRRQLEYKARWNGGTVVAVDRWFPSSKLCHGCGEINADLTLAEREWICPNCGQRNDRDNNAAKNIRDEAVKILTESHRSTHTGL